MKQTTRKVVAVENGAYRLSGAGACRSALGGVQRMPQSRARDLASSEVFSLLMLRAFGLVCLIFVFCSSSANAGDMRTFSEEEEEKKPTTTTTAKNENDVRYSQYMFMCF